MARKRLGEILISAGVLDVSRLQAALTEQRRWGGQLGRILVDMKLVSEEVLVKALAHQLNFPIVDLEKQQVAAEVLELVPGELAEQHHIVPFQREGKFLDVAMSDPTNMGIIDELRIRTQLNVRPYLAGPRKIERAIARYYGRGLGILGVDPRAGQRQGGYDEVDAIDLDLRAPFPPGGGARRARTGDPAPSAEAERAAEIRSLQQRISKLEALIARDEDVLRKLLSLLIEKGVASREEILERIK
jgi:type IV pilus assembly protein PilB